MKHGELSETSLAVLKDLCTAKLSQLNEEISIVSAKTDVTAKQAVAEVRPLIQQQIKLRITRQKEVRKPVELVKKIYASKYRTVTTGPRKADS
jgi:hypothetical protein